jgi:hypothetical protein
MSLQDGAATTIGTTDRCSISVRESVREWSGNLFHSVPIYAKYAKSEATVLTSLPLLNSLRISDLRFLAGETHANALTAYGTEGP